MSTGDDEAIADRGSSGPPPVELVGPLDVAVGRVPADERRLATGRACRRHRGLGRGHPFGVVAGPEFGEVVEAAVGDDGCARPNLADGPVWDSVVRQAAVG